MPASLLPEHEIVSRLAELNAASAQPWVRTGHAISRVYTFADFAAAFAFMTRVAAEAERLGHHPDWRNAWNRVEVSLTTHDAGGLTGLDFQLAAAIEAFSRSPGAATPTASPRSNA